MRRPVRRGLAAAALLGALVMTAPGTVQAATQCGLVVCAEAVATASWDCTTTDNIIAGHDYIECRGTARPDARGYSGQSIPGSLTRSGSTQYSYIYNFGTFTGTGPATQPSRCTWAGLGEDSCGGSGEEVLAGLGGYVPFGSCLDSFFQIDVEVAATSTATATKSLPLGLATIDSAIATETASARLSALPVQERCAFQ